MANSILRFLLQFLFLPMCDLEVCCLILQVFGDSPVFFLLVISCLIPLWSGEQTLHAFCSLKFVKACFLPLSGLSC